jgi:hypothetical protein
MVAQQALSRETLARMLVREFEGVWEELAEAPDAAAVEERVGTWMRAQARTVLEAALQARVRRQEQAEGVCCGERMAHHSRRTRHALTLFGAVQVPRSYRRCGRCGRSWVPGDAWLGWEGGFSFGVAEAVAYVCAGQPYREGLATLQKLVGVELSVHAAEEIVRRWGAEELTLAPYAQRAMADLLVQIDGTTVHLEEGWKELKLGAICGWDRLASEKERLGEVSYAGGWLSAEAFRTPLWQEVVVRGAARARAVAVLGDGAAWIWELVRWLFPRAVEILDWYHVSEHLWEAARAVHGEGTAPTARLAKQWETEVWEGHSGGVEAHLRELVRQGRDDAHGTLRKCADYLDTHHLRLRYPYFRAQGWPVGSGVVEGACKHVVGMRFKRKSTRWTRDGGEAVLRLRLDRLNGRWHARQEHMRLAA